MTLNGDVHLLRFVQLTSKIRADTSASKAYYVSLLAEARLKQEISVLKELSHAGLEKLLLIPAPLNALEGVAIITNYYDQDLEARCNAQYPGGRALCADLLQSMHVMSGAVAYLHSKRICHRKICPSKIRLKSALPPHEHWHQNLVLCGFKDAARMNSAAMAGRVGSLRYIAPEMLQGPSYSEKVDVWSMVCSIASFVLSGQERKIRDASFRVLITSIGSEGRLSTDTMSLLASRDPIFTQLQVLISGGLRQDPSERCSARELRDSVRQSLRGPSAVGCDQVHHAQLAAPQEWRKSVCLAFSTISQVPLCTNDVVEITKDLSLSIREVILAWFRNFEKVCAMLSIDATGPSAAVAFSMTQCNSPDASEQSKFLDLGCNHKKRRRKQL